MTIWMTYFGIVWPYHVSIRTKCGKEVQMWIELFWHWQCVLAFCCSVLLFMDHYWILYCMYVGKSFIVSIEYLYYWYRCECPAYQCSTAGRSQRSLAGRSFLGAPSDGNRHFVCLGCTHFPRGGGFHHSHAVSVSPDSSIMELSVTAKEAAPKLCVLPVSALPWCPNLPAPPWWFLVACTPLWSTAPPWYLL